MQWIHGRESGIICSAIYLFVGSDRETSVAIVTTKMLDQFI